MKREQFRDFLLGLQKPFIIKLETATKLRMNKTHRETKEPNPFYDKVIKKAVRVGKIGVSYENVVTNQRGREAAVGETIEAFNAESLWNGKGEHVSGALVRHKESLKEYLAILPNSSKDNDVLISDEILVFDGKEVSKDILEPYLPPPRKDSGFARQETDRHIFWQCIELDNVKGVIYKGESISIED